jgi:uncharacterized lipoprotein YmbA
MKRWPWIMLLMPILAACGRSPPVHFFTLAPVAPTRRPTAVSGPPIQIAAVHIPPAMDRRSMVRGEAGHQLKFLDQDRWGAPFASMAREVLTRDLAQRLPARMVVAANLPTPRSARSVVVSILHFQPNSAGRITMDADWSLLQGTRDQVVFRDTIHLHENEIGKGAGAQASAMSIVLGKLADNIASAVAHVDPSMN